MLKGKYNKLMIGSKGPIIRVYEGDQLIWKSDQYIKQNVLRGTTSNGTDFLYPLTINGVNKSADIEFDGKNWEIPCTSPTSISFYSSASNNSTIDSIDFTDVDGSQITSCQEMFRGLCNLKTLDLSQLNLSNKLTNMNQMFRSCEGLESLIFPAWDTTNVTNIAQFLNATTVRPAQLTTLDCSMFVFPKVTYASSAFLNQSALTTLNVSGWGMEACKSFESMFQNCSSLTELDLSSWDVTCSSDTSIKNMFNNCTNLEVINLSSFKDIHNVINQSTLSVFGGCNSLDYILITDMSQVDANYLVQCLGWDKPGNRSTWRIIGDRILSPTDNRAIVGNATGSVSIIVDNVPFEVYQDSLRFGNVVTSPVASYKNAFKNNITITALDLSYSVKYGPEASLTDTESMFDGCTNLQSITWLQFDSRNCTSYANMFRGCDSLSLVVVDRYQEFLLDRLNEAAAGGSITWHVDPSSSNHLIP